MTVVETRSRERGKKRPGRQDFPAGHGPHTLHTRSVCPFSSPWALARCIVPASPSKRLDGQFTSPTPFRPPSVLSPVQHFEVRVTDRGGYWPRHAFASPSLPFSTKRTNGTRTPTTRHQFRDRTERLDPSAVTQDPRSIMRTNTAHARQRRRCTVCCVPSATQPYGGLVSSPTGKLSFVRADTVVITNVARLSRL